LFCWLNFVVSSLQGESEFKLWGYVRASKTLALLRVFPLDASRITLAFTSLRLSCSHAMMEGSRSSSTVNCGVLGGGWTRVISLCSCLSVFSAYCVAKEHLALDR